MPKTKDDRRREFFDRGVAAYQRVMETDLNLYFCPICEKPFGRDALDDKRLTLEHVPPRALKGRAILLTCLQCQKLGSRQDAAVKDRTRIWDLNEAIHGREGGYKGRAMLDFDGLKVSSDLDVRPGRGKFIPWTKTNNPVTLAAAMARYATQSRAGTLSFKLTPRTRFDARLSKVGDLKTAYLAAFAKFGYTYAADQRLSAVRQQIRQPKAEILPNWWILPTTAEREWPALVLLNHPTEAIAVYLRTAIVVLPEIGTVGDPYSALKAAANAEGILQISGSPLGWPKGMEMQLDFSEE